MITGVLCPFMINLSANGCTDVPQGRDPFGAAGFGEDLEGLGVRPGGGLELEPVGCREQVVRLPGQLERDGAED
ncbi:hypothetical protein [Streptomyces sp. NPDC060077]|uniref:hypothetical protein n=1 Tax=Streptomyces sp. NPDC060077 TaxID=3347052 RepID=UPI003669C61C